VVVAGDIVARPILTLTATFDHRYTDGFHAARFATAVRDYLTDPAKFEGLSPLVRPAASAGTGPQAAP
jgi:pyruvate dehydrogenase E2 component (dihydrolipoamide acetyltransferase)